ncbi:MAG: hypothetical protein KDG54_11230 [Geminicoccaceae bacterium]|nr:hypothetical protein [Geminicoccaceae bacterium]
MNRHRKKIIVFAALVVAVLAFEVFKLTPYNKMEYRPFCYENREYKYLDGELNLKYRDHIILWLVVENFWVWADDRKLFITMFPMHNEGSLLFPDRGELFENIEGKIIEEIWNDRYLRYRGRKFYPNIPLEKAVEDLEREMSVNTDNKWEFWNHCKVKRAGALLVERMGADPAVDGEKH